jgi:periplasmic protein TonB
VDMRPPVYPPRCLRLGIEGRVKIRVLVGENGRPQEVTVGESSGESALDQAALEAVREWRFEPAKRNGVAVRAWAIVPVEFKLID